MPKNLEIIIANISGEHILQHLAKLYLTKLLKSIVNIVATFQNKISWHIQSWRATLYVNSMFTYTERVVSSVNYVQTDTFHPGDDHQEGENIKVRRASGPQACET